MIRLCKNNERIFNYIRIDIIAVLFLLFMPANSSQVIDSTVDRGTLNVRITGASLHWIIQKRFMKVKTLFL
jgi:hypothetical protein